jgi:hypothetical protein
LEQWSFGDALSISDFGIIRVAHDHMMLEDNLVHAEMINAPSLPVAISLVLIAVGTPAESDIHIAKL